MTFSPYSSARLALTLMVICCAALVGCNDKPTDIGANLVPGTDTIFVSSTLQKDLLGGFATISERQPIFNSTYFLYGKTDDSEGRLFVEFIGLPDLGNLDSVEIISAELVFHPQAYRYGDTNDRTLSIRAYELQKVWSAQATWDSIWAADGSTDYYSVAQPSVIDFTQQATDLDTTIDVPIDTAAVRNWLRIANDSTSAEEIYGMVLLPETGSSINQYRNLESNTQIMQLRLITKVIGDTVIDTNDIGSAVACFVDTPDPDEGELLMQGARVHSFGCEINIDSLPDFAVLVGAKLRIDVNENASTIGTLGMDDLISVSYTANDGSLISITTRGDTETGIFEFSNVTPLLSQIRLDGGVGSLKFSLTDIYEIWRMNRLQVHDLSAPANVRPYLDIVYVVPTVFQ